MAVADLVETRQAEARKLGLIYDYLHGRHARPYQPGRLAEEYAWIRDRATVNVMPLVVETFVSSLFVDGYRPKNDSENVAAWDIDWQANRMDARQAMLWRSMVSYGAGYLWLRESMSGAVAWRPKSPRFCTSLYDDPLADEYPVEALLIDEQRPSQGIYVDRERIAKVAIDPTSGKVTEEASKPHRFGFVPVIRAVNRWDADGNVEGEVYGLIRQQDQVNFTTQGLLITTLYQAFQQWHAAGWVLEEDASGRPVEPKAGPGKILIAEDADVKFGQFDQADLGGYLESRQSALQLAAMVAQISPQDLGASTVANISAEALLSLEVGKRRKVAGMQTSGGEAVEQAFRTSAAIRGDADGAADTSSQVTWRGDIGESFASIVDGLTKLHAVGVPLAWLVERIPGVTQTDAERIMALAEDQSMQDAQAQAAAFGIGGLTADAAVA